MKCEHCGKNEATFYYKSNINGTVTEQRLCAECAKELGYMDGLQKQFAEMERNMFTPFENFFAPMPVLAGSMFGGALRPFARMAQIGSGEEATHGSMVTEASVGNDLVSAEEHQQLKQQCQINALRHEMQEAIKTENFERAAELRDQIRGLENRA